MASAIHNINKYSNSVVHQSGNRPGCLSRIFNWFSRNSRSSTDQTTSRISQRIVQSTPSKARAINLAVAKPQDIHKTLDNEQEDQNLNNDEQKEQSVDARQRTTTHSKSSRATLINKLFEEDKLIIRGMDQNVFRRLQNETPRLDNRNFSDYKRELSLAKDTRLVAAGTLLVKNANIVPYHPTGLFLNGKTCNIEHISLGDSSSNKDNHGKLQASNTNQVNSLEELASFFRKQSSGDEYNYNPHTYNEVNANFKFSDMIGIFTSTSQTADNRDKALSRTKAQTIRHFIKKKWNIDLPIFEYTTDAGEIKEVKDRDLKRNVMQSKGLDKRKKGIVLQYLGLEMSRSIRN